MNKGNKACKLEIADLTNEQARTWLIANDREAAEFWRTYPDDDLIGAVKDNLNSFGWENQLGEIIVSQPVITDKIKIKTAELSGAALDWAVAKCEGRTITNDLGGAVWVKGRHEDGHELDGFDSVFKATDWIHGGPIIELGKIELRTKSNYWESVKRLENGWLSQQGKTPLIAAMRCYVAYKLGNEVEVPSGVVVDENSPSRSASVRPKP